MTFSLHATSKMVDHCSSVSARLLYEVVYKRVPARAAINTRIRSIFRNSGKDGTLEAVEAGSPPPPKKRDVYVSVPLC